MNSSLSQNPIFIVGFYRSGTTFLQSLLCTQGLYSFPETHFFSITNKISCKSPISSKDFDDIKLKLKINLCFEFTKELDEQILQKINEQIIYKKDLFELLVMELLKKRSVTNFNEIVWLEKTPAHCLNIFEINELYPAAKFIFIVRNPLSSIISCKKNLKHFHEKSVYKIAENLIDFNNEAKKFCNIYPNKLYLIKYESLIKDTENEMSKLLSYLNMEIDLILLNTFIYNIDSIILPHETWKLKNKIQLLVNMKEHLHKDLSFIKIIKLEFYLFNYLLDYEYRIHYMKSIKILKFISKYITNIKLFIKILTGYKNSTKII